jgi:hypothetical protein
MGVQPRRLLRFSPAVKTTREPGSKSVASTTLLRKARGEAGGNGEPGIRGHHAWGFGGTGWRICIRPSRFANIIGTQSFRPSSWRPVQRRDTSAWIVSTKKHSAAPAPTAQFVKNNSLAFRRRKRRTTIQNGIKTIHNESNGGTDRHFSDASARQRTLSRMKPMGVRFA